jgi:acyl-CoA reductase-like NAD-dependent aldehyde dehydrogenase
MITYNELFIGGQWVTPHSSTLLEVRSPHDQSLIGRAAQALPADIDKAVAAARKAFDHGPWPLMSPEERQAVVTRLGEVRATRSKEASAMITAERGAPRWFASWIETGIREQAAAYVRAAAAFEWEKRLDPTGTSKTIVTREPIGVVAAVVPWNAPNLMSMAKIVPAVLAGNTVVLKASPENSLSEFLLAEIFAEAGFPEGVVSIVPADRETSEYLISHADVDKISFTGSTAAGRRIAAIAGEQLKPVGLELGGKSASIILEDADLSAVTEGLKWASFGNNTENCQAHTRILAPRSRYEEIVEAVKRLVESLVVGDPSAEETFIGPMIRPGQQQRVQSYIELGIKEGARLITGGADVPKGLESGNYVRPTLFADVDNGMRIAQEEIFGPVIVVIPYEDEEDAIRIANDSPYGLGGGVWSADTERAIAVARRIQSGFVTVNAAPVAWDAPFGGYKASGLGRENGPVGFGEYLEYKTIMA